MARRGARPSVPPSPEARRPDAKREPDVADAVRPMIATSPSPAGRPPASASASAGSPSGLTAALVTARAYCPSEPDLKDGAGTGLYWVLALLVVAGLAHRRRAGRRPIPVPLVVDRCRGRRPDAPGRHQLAARARSAAGDQPGLGMGRDGCRLPPVPQPAPDPRASRRSWPARWSRPRSPSRSTGSIRSASSCRRSRARFIGAIPSRILPSSKASPRARRPRRSSPNRLLGSNEVLSTFALANSLAGFIVGPLVLGAGRLVARTWCDARSRAIAMAALLMAAPVILVLLVCLILTKSRQRLARAAGRGRRCWPGSRGGGLPTRLLVASGIGRSASSSSRWSRRAWRRAGSIARC